MKIEVLRTYEISEKQWFQIYEGFMESFDVKDNDFKPQEGLFTNNKQGYGYHALAYSDEGNIIGYTIFSPTFYENGLKILVGGSTFIRKHYRDDFLLFAKIVNALKKRCSEDGYQVVIAVPNANSKDYAIRINRFVYVDDLNYYILPLHPSKILHKPALYLLDDITNQVFKIWISFNVFFSKLFNHSAKEKTIRLIVDEEFYSSRFKEDCYICHNSGKYRYCYRHYDEDGTDTIYLMDFRENGKRTSRALSFCLKEILKKDKADAILFVGFLDMKQSSLIKVPKRFVPKPLPFTFHVIDKKNKELVEIMKNRSAWDFSLMNFDVR